MTVFLGDTDRAATLTTAAQLLGSRLFGPDQWAQQYLASTHQQILDEIPAFPWGADLLESECPFAPNQAIAQTHVAFLGLAALEVRPLTLWRWKSIHPEHFNARRNPWYRGQPFVHHTTCGSRWYLMPLPCLLTPVAQTYAEHLALLPPEYEVPRSIEEATKLLLYRHLNNHFPSPYREFDTAGAENYTWSWCQETIKREGVSRQIAISSAGMRRIKIGAFPLRKPRENLGLAASRKLPIVM